MCVGEERRLMLSGVCYIAHFNDNRSKPLTQWGENTQPPSGHLSERFSAVEISDGVENDLEQLLE